MERKLKIGWLVIGVEIIFDEWNESASATPTALFMTNDIDELERKLMHFGTTTRSTPVPKLRSIGDDTIWTMPIDNNNQYGDLEELHHDTPIGFLEDIRRYAVSESPEDILLIDELIQKFKNIEKEYYTYLENQNQQTAEKAKKTKRLRDLAVLVRMNRPLSVDEHNFIADNAELAKEYSITFESEDN